MSDGPVQRPKRSSGQSIIWNPVWVDEDTPHQHRPRRRRKPSAIGGMRSCGVWSSELHGTLLELLGDCETCETWYLSTGYGSGWTHGELSTSKIFEGYTSSLQQSWLREHKHLSVGLAGLSDAAIAAPKAKHVGSHHHEIVGKVHFRRNHMQLFFHF